jgi:hypothetical protein
MLSTVPNLFTLDVATLAPANLIYPAMPWRKGNRLRLVTEEQADAETRHIFEEIKRALGLPALQLFHPALANYPTFLKLHWELLRDIAQSRELFDLAERLRADAYTRAHNYFHIPDLSRHERHAENNGDSAKLALVAEFYHYKEPLLLLLFCVQMQALEGPAGIPGSPTPHEAREIIREAPCVLNEDVAPPALKKCYEEVRRTLEVPFVNPEFCAFASWPDFLDRYWATLKQMIASPLYDECMYGVRATAWALASQLPGPVELTVDRLADAGMAAEEIASIARIMEMFVRNLSGQLLNVAAAKIALEGGNLAIPESQSRRKKKQPAA